jgi:hypothetical protein
LGQGRSTVTRGGSPETDVAKLVEGRWLNWARNHRYGKVNFRLAETYLWLSSDTEGVIVALLPGCWLYVWR